MFEAARVLGGRARTVPVTLPDGRTALLDNGQHILIGAYRETLALIAEVGAGASALLRLPLHWKVLPRFELRAAPLPAPWHLAAGLLRAKGLTPAARFACVRFMAWAQGIFTFDTGAAYYIAEVHPVFKLHLFLGLTIFLLFPFTRLVHMLSAPVRYLWRPGYQVVRARPSKGPSAGAPAAE